MICRVRWRPEAVADLNGIYDWIKQRADRHTAFEYTSALEARALRLLDAPWSGTPHPELSAGLRSVAYRRRTIIFYRVEDDQVAVIRVAHGGRNLERMFPGR